MQEKYEYGQIKAPGVEAYKKAPTSIAHKVFKMKDFYVFELEGKNSIEYDFLDSIEKDQHTQSGYFMVPEKVISSVISDGSDEPPAEVPMILEG